MSSRSLLRRILLLTLLFVAELILISVWLDTGSLVQRARLVEIIHDWGAWVLRGIVGFAAIFATVACLKRRGALNNISAQVAEFPIRWSLLAAHWAAMGTFSGLSFVLFGGRGIGGLADLLAASWLLAGASAIAFAGLALLPRAVWAQLFRSTGYLWAYASTAVVSACLVGGMFRSLWQPASYLTYWLTKVFLSPFVSGIITDPATLTVGTPEFQVEIAPQCSGLEGVGLVLAFGVLSLLVFRKECRFPRSLILIPLAVTLIFLLNSLRIAALVLIGNAGAREVALGGFHSQAGWIAFSAVGAGFCFVLQRVPWFTKSRRNWESPTTVTHNPTAAFLLPFLVILAAGMITRAVAGADVYGFRFFAAFVVLFALRRNYTNLNWQWDWSAPVIGACVFIIWVGLDHFSNPTADHDVSAGWMSSSPLAKLIWIIFRVAAVVVTIPLAEELAFRGFLMRRLLSRNFESVSFQRFSWFALLASSVAFGFLQGGYWTAGSIAGILFGLAAIRRGRIGDAVVAHASANALLAVYILTFHKRHFWY
jgi:exosortase E/protease (VPEID-CTERM system)